MRKVRLNESQAESVECHHLDQAREVGYEKQVCPECVKLHDTWVHLRICLICGHVGSAARPRTGAQGPIGECALDFLRSRKRSRKCDKLSASLSMLR